MKEELIDKLLEYDTDVKLIASYIYYNDGLPSIDNDDEFDNLLEDIKSYLADGLSVYTEDEVYDIEYNYYVNDIQESLKNSMYYYYFTDYIYNIANNLAEDSVMNNYNEITFESTSKKYTFYILG